MKITPGIVGVVWGFIGGHLRFNLSGPTGRSVVVEASSDLQIWLPIWTNTFADPFNFSDPQGGIYSNRYCRTRFPARPKHYNPTKPHNHSKQKKHNDDSYDLPLFHGA